MISISEPLTLRTPKLIFLLLGAIISSWAPYVLVLFLLSIGTSHSEEISGLAIFSSLLPMQGGLDDFPIVFFPTFMGIMCGLYVYREDKLDPLDVASITGLALMVSVPYTLLAGLFWAVLISFSSVNYVEGQGYVPISFAEGLIHVPVWLFLVYFIIFFVYIFVIAPSIFLSVFLFRLIALKRVKE